MQLFLSATAWVEGNRIAVRVSKMNSSECKYCGVAWGWLKFLLDPERSEQASFLHFSPELSINKADHWAAGEPQQQILSASRKKKKKHAHKLLLSQHAINK